MQALLGPTLHLLVAATFGLVAAYQWRRRGGQSHRTARRFFILWWVSLTVVELCASAQGYLAASGNHSVAWHAGLSYLMAFAFSIGLWGLLTYAFYLWGAPERIWIGTGTYYGLYGGLALATIAWLDPIDVVSTGAGIRLVFAREISATWLRLLGALFLIPPLVAALSILHVARLEVEPQVRRRAIVVGLGLIAWCISTWMSIALASNALMFLPVIMDGIAGMLIVSAYHFIGFTNPVVFERVDPAPLGAPQRAVADD